MFLPGLEAKQANKQTKASCIKLIEVLGLYLEVGVMYDCLLVQKCESTAVSRLLAFGRRKGLLRAASRKTEKRIWGIPADREKSNCAL